MSNEDKRRSDREMKMKEQKRNVEGEDWWALGIYQMCF